MVAGLRSLCEQGPKSSINKMEEKWDMESFCFTHK